MDILRGLRLGVLLLIMVVAIGIAVLNPGERVLIDLFFAEPFENVPLVFVMFCAFLVGFAGGLVVAVVKLVELQTALRTTRRSQTRIAGELSTLRNLALEETEEKTTPHGMTP
jgi:uncharacterized integral membrane protein